MSFKNSVVNRNDNFRHSWVTMGDLKFNAMCAPFISYADKLIQNHGKAWWKNQPQSGDYQMAQFLICTHLRFPEPTKEWTLRLIAIPLNCDPIILMNADLPELEGLPLNAADAENDARYAEKL